MISPKRLFFGGGGFISFGLAHITARAGREVHIVHRGEQPLDAFDAQIVDLLLENAKEVDVNVHLNSEVQSVMKTGTDFKVTAKTLTETSTWSRSRTRHR